MSSSKINKTHKAKLIFVCGRELQYIRNSMLWQTLARHFDTQLVADSRSGSLLLRLTRLIPQLIYHLRQPHDFLMVGFYGYPLVLLARCLTQAPLLFDAFVSTYDTLCFDRQIFEPNTTLGQLTFYLDKSACLQADKVLLDTQTHARYFQQTFDLVPSKTDSLYLGCDETIFYPRLIPTFPRLFTVFTYSTYLPLHGTETIIKAAQRCQGYPIQFRLVGDTGQTYQQTRDLASSLQLQNVTFIPTIPFSQLPVEISQASLCLGGHFGSSAKAGRVIAGKTYQFMAMKRPVVVGDNLTNQEVFTDQQTAYFCAMNDPQALAEAIIHLYEAPDLRNHLAQQAAKLFQNRFTWQRLGQQLVHLVESLLN